VDKLYPEKPAVLLKKPQSTNLTGLKLWKNNAMKALLLLLQTTFTLGIALVVIWSTKSDGTTTHITQFTPPVIELKAYYYHGSCFELYGNKELGWYGFNRCLYPIEPMLTCLDTNSLPDTIGVMQSRSEVSFTGEFSDCERLTVLLEDKSSAGITLELETITVGLIRMMRAEDVVIYGNSTLGWRVFNQGKYTVYPTFRCFGINCAMPDANLKALQRTIVRSPNPLPAANEVEISSSKGCDLCVVLLENDF